MQNDEFVIHKTSKKDLKPLKKIYKDAFPDEDLFPLVLELFDDSENTMLLSAFNGDEVLGNIAFTNCRVGDSPVIFSLLGPLVVAPRYQRNGIGGALIEQGKDLLKEEGIEKVLVLGDPAYYTRAGFAVETHVKPAYQIPQEWEPAWQSVELTQSKILYTGSLQVTEPWQNKKLWSE